MKGVTIVSRKKEKTDMERGGKIYNWRICGYRVLSMHLHLQAQVTTTLIPKGRRGAYIAIRPDCSASLDPASLLRQLEASRWLGRADSEAIFLTFAG